jgi:hypothetical protein
VKLEGVAWGLGPQTSVRVKNYLKLVKGLSGISRGFAVRRGEKEFRVVMSYSRVAGRY